MKADSATELLVVHDDGEEHFLFSAWINNNNYLIESTAPSIPRKKARSNPRKEGPSLPRITGDPNKPLLLKIHPLLLKISPLPNNPKKRKLSPAGVYFLIS
jgi:hypothetical protein